MQIEFTIFGVKEADFADWLQDVTENQFQPCTLEVQPTSKPGYKQYHWVLSGRVIAWITTKKAQSFIKVTLAQSVLPGTELDGDDVPEIVGAVCRLFKLRGWGYDSPNAVLENMELQIGFWLSEGNPYLEKPPLLPASASEPAPIVTNFTEPEPQPEPTQSEKATIPREYFRYYEGIKRVRAENDSLKLTHADLAEGIKVSTRTIDRVLKFFEPKKLKSEPEITPK